MKYLLLSITALLLSSQALPAHASLVKDVDLQTACNGSIPLVVYEGMGATLDFTNTAFTVQRAWLGDPSRLTLDTDIPMDQPGTSIIYLRAIERLNFDGLPATATTVLSTRISNGSTIKVCQLPISYSSGQPTYTSLRLNDSSASPEAEVNISRLLSNLVANVDHVEAGINLNAAALGEDDLVVLQIREFIQKVRDGETQQTVAQELNVEWRLIKELERQGSTNLNPYRETTYL